MACIGRANITGNEPQSRVKTSHGSKFHVYVPYVRKRMSKLPTFVRINYAEVSEPFERRQPMGDCRCNECFAFSYEA